MTSLWWLPRRLQSARDSTVLGGRRARHGAAWRGGARCTAAAFCVWTRDAAAHRRPRSPPYRHHHHHRRRHLQRSSETSAFPIFSCHTTFYSALRLFVYFFFLQRKMAAMKIMSFLILLSLIVTVMSAPKECIKNQLQCVNNKECCEGCCHEGKCLSHADGCSVQLNPCSLHYCSSGKVCYLQQVACVAANCDPVPACKDPDYDYE